MKRLQHLQLLSSLAVLAAAGCGRIESPFKPAQMQENFILATPQEIAQNQVAPGSYIVTFRGPQTGGNTLNFASFLAEYRQHYTPLAGGLLSDPRIHDIQFLTAVDLVKPGAAVWEAEFGTPRSMQLFAAQSKDSQAVGSISRVDFRSEDDAKEVLAEWDQKGLYWFAEPNYNNTLCGAYETYAKTYASTETAQQKKINLVKAFTALGSSADNSPIIAVMDSGVDYQHPALAANMWVNDKPGASGCEDDEHGCNTTGNLKGILGNGDIYPYGASGPGQACPTSDECATGKTCQHGTHVAGIIAAKNEGGVGGICPTCRIMAIRIIGKSPTNANCPATLDSSIIAGLKYITQFRTDDGSFAVRVVNASFGKFQRSKAVGLLVRVLKESGMGTLLVAAAGNEDTMKMSYPAAFTDALAVSNISNSGAKHASSNFGRWVDIAAPGEDIVSTFPGGSSGPKTGTSMASPIVAGVAGLVLVKNPTFSYNELRSALLNASDAGIYTDEINANYNPHVPGEVTALPLLGAGMLNAEGAVKPGTANISTADGLDRVTGQCGMLATVNPANNSWLIWVVLLLPFAACLMPRLRQSLHSK